MSTQAIVPDKLRALLALANSAPAPQTNNPAATQTIPNVPVPPIPPQAMTRLDVPQVPPSPGTAGQLQQPAPAQNNPAAATANTGLRLLTDQNELRRLQTSGSGIDQITHPIDPATGLPTTQQPSMLRRFGGVLAKIGNVGADLALGRGAGIIPGTDLHHQMLLNQQTGIINNALGDEQTQAGNALRNAQAAYYQQHAGAVGLRPITPEEAAAMGNPSLAGTLAAPMSISHMLTTAATNQTREKVSDTQASARTTAAQIAAVTRQNIAELKPEQRDDHAIAILSKPPNERTPDDIAYLTGYDQWVKQTKIDPGVEKAKVYAQWRPVQVVGPDGNTYYASAATAINTHAPGTSSIPFRTASAMARYMTSGKGGGTMTAYRTATDHLDLLGQAAEALQNGDIPTFNRVGNALAQETGGTAPTNFDAVKSMLAGELANVAKASGATDQEIAEERAQINRASSPAQIAGLIKTNQDLMDQKAQEMFEQYQSGMQGQPVTTTGGINPSTRTALTPHGGGNASNPGSSTGGGSAPDGTIVKMADGSTQVKRNGKWVAQ